MRVAGSSLNLTARAAERSQAAMWARSLLDSAFALEPIRPGTTSGRFDQRFAWQLAVTPWRLAGTRPDPMSLPGPSAGGLLESPESSELATPLHMYQLDLHVMWVNGSHHYDAHFSTLRLSTAVAAAGAPP